LTHWSLEASNVQSTLTPLSSLLFTKLTDPFEQVERERSCSYHHLLEPSYSPAILKSQQWSWW